MSFHPGLSSSSFILTKRLMTGSLLCASLIFSGFILPSLSHKMLSSTVKFCLLVPQNAPSSFPYLKLLLFLPPLEDITTSFVIRVCCLPLLHRDRFSFFPFPGAAPIPFLLYCWLFHFSLLLGLFLPYLLFFLLIPLLLRSSDYPDITLHISTLFTGTPGHGICINMFLSSPVFQCQCVCVQKPAGTSPFGLGDMKD